MNVCTECKHYADFGNWWETIHACLVEGMADPIDGKRVGRACQVQRAEGGSCGPEGKLFEPIPAKEAA